MRQPPRPQDARPGRGARHAQSPPQDERGGRGTSRGTNGGTSHELADTERYPGGHDHLQRPARPEVEEVQQVRRARDERGVDRDVRGRAAGEGGRGDAGHADAAELHRPGGHLAVGEGAEVTTEAAPVARSGDVVVTAESGRTGRSGGEGGAGPGRHPGSGGGRDRAGQGRRRALKQRDRLAAVVRAGPAFRPARRATGEGRVRGAGGRGRDHRRDG